MAGFLSTVTAPALYDQGTAGTARVYSPNNPPPSSTTNTTAAVVAQVMASGSLTLTTSFTLVPGCTYTVPTTGTYQINLSGDFGFAAGDGTLVGTFYIDGAFPSVRKDAIYYPGAGASGATGVIARQTVLQATVLTLNAGQVITLVGSKTGGTAASTLGGQHTGFTVLLEPSFTVTTTGGGGGSGPSAVLATSTYTATSGQAVLANGTFAVTLPAAVAGAQVTIKNTGTGTITVTRAGTALIDGVSTFPLTTQYSAITVISDGTDWFVI